MKLTINNPDIETIDKTFYTHINEYDKKYECYLVRYEFKLCFNNKKDYGIASSILTDNKTMVSWKIFVEYAINIFKIDGLDFSHISQMNVLIVCNKMHKTYDFYMKHNKPAVECNINQLINKEKNLIKKLPATWFHPLYRQFESYRV